MEIDLKQIIILLLNLIGSALLFIWLESREYFSQGFGVFDFLVLFVVSVVVIFFIIYAKFREINKSLLAFSKKIKSISESLKRSEDLINIKADIMYLKNDVKNGKN